MIEGIEFSDKGERPSDFEKRLLTESRSESPWLCVARRLMQDLGPEIGPIALVAVLDEVGGEKLHISTRRHFFESLWRIERDKLIRDLSTRPDWNQADIARALGLSREYVRRVIEKTPPQRTTKASRAW